MTGNRLLLTEDTLFWAFRYALGRRTYAVSMVVDEILGVWEDITLRTREQITREILEAEAKDMHYIRVGIPLQASHLGQDMDKEQWFRIVNKFKEENPDEYQGVKNSLR